MTEKSAGTSECHIVTILQFHNCIEALKISRGPEIRGLLRREQLQLCYSSDKHVVNVSLHQIIQGDFLNGPHLFVNSNFFLSAWSMCVCVFCIYRHGETIQLIISEIKFN